MTTTHTTLRAGAYDEVHAQVEQLARGLHTHDYLDGTWLCELAISLALHDGLVVTVINYDNSGQELEIRLASAPNSDGVVIGQGASADQLQVWLDLSVGIKDGPSVEAATSLVQALLRASCPTAQD